ncbi:MAG: glycosyltransferase family 4 protein, partial [Phycisphaerales bacterium]|nr:glycosyltransferase family 4 protein [Phycisphaerales bacterium]
MRIAHLTPGTGHFYCGNCLREATLARALRRLGHDSIIVPLYLPVFSEQDGTDDRISMGGINVYLRHRFPGLRIPRPVGRWMDDARLLRWAARRGDMTDATSHASFAVSMLEGTIPVEAERLLERLRDLRPDVVCLCNLLLVGLVRELRALDVPIIVSMHGEHGYLDQMPEPSRTRAWEAIRTGLHEVDGIIAVSDWYRRTMAERLGLAPERIDVVHNGIDLDDVEAHDAHGTHTIGYLARMCDEKG